MAFLSTTRRTLTSLLSRTLSPPPLASTSLISPRSRFALALFDKQTQLVPESMTIPARHKTTGSGYSPLNDPSPNWSNRPPKETILLDGCDYEHWLIVMEFPTDPKPTEEEMVNSYVKTLASVLGSEEEAKKKIYMVSTNTYTGFGALISEELSYKVKGLPGVLWVLPDSYLDVPNKDYGGDLFVDGKVIHRPQFWYQERQQSKNRPRPRYDRRRDTMPVERRVPMSGQREVGQQSASMAGQNSSQIGGRDVSVNQGGSYQGNQGGFSQGYQGGFNQGNQGGFNQGNQGGFNQGNQGGSYQGNQ